MIQLDTTSSTITLHPALAISNNSRENTFFSLCTHGHTRVVGKRSVTTGNMESAKYYKYIIVSVRLNTIFFHLIAYYRKGGRRSITPLSRATSVWWSCWSRLVPRLWTKQTRARFPSATRRPTIMSKFSPTSYKRKWTRTSCWRTGRWS